MSQTTLDIKEPGLNVLPPGVERHVVNAGGLTGLQIFPDDEIEIIRADNNDIIFFIFFPSIININDKVCSDLKV